MLSLVRNAGDLLEIFQCAQVSCEMQWGNAEGSISCCSVFTVWQTNMYFQLIVMFAVFSSLLLLCSTFRCALCAATKDTEHTKLERIPTMDGSIYINTQRWPYVLLIFLSFFLSSFNLQKATRERKKNTKTNAKEERKTNEK